MSLGTSGGGDWLNLEIAAAGNTEVVRSKLRVMQTLGLNDTIEDILITLHRQYHLIRLMSGVKARGRSSCTSCWSATSRTSRWRATSSSASRTNRRSEQLGKGVRAGGTGAHPLLRQCTSTGWASRDTATCRSTNTASTSATATSTAEIQNARWKPEVSASSRPTPDASNDDV